MRQYIINDSYSHDTTLAAAICCTLYAVRCLLDFPTPRPGSPNSRQFVNTTWSPICQRSSIMVTNPRPFWGVRVCLYGLIYILNSQLSIFGLWQWNWAYTKKQRSPWIESTVDPHSWFVREDLRWKHVHYIDVI